MEYIIGITVMLLIVILFKTPLGNGIYRKWMMRLVVGKNRPKKDLFVIHDMMFYDGTKSLSIDHVVINKDGVHIISTSYESGIISGKEQDKIWTISSTFGKQRLTMENPIHKNNLIKLSLKQVMPMQVPLYGYVCFPGRTKVKVKSSETPVVGPRLLKHVISKHRKPEVILKPLEVRKLYEALKNLKKQTFKYQNISIQNNPKKAYQKDSYLKSER
jgi:hypothetical protein